MQLWHVGQEPKPKNRYRAKIVSAGREYGKGPMAAEKRTKVPNPMATGGISEGWEVSVKESTERWSEVTLEDGTVLRVKPSVIGAVRMDNMYDAEGNPVYALKATQTMAIVNCPEHLKKGKQTQGKVQ